MSTKLPVLLLPGMMCDERVFAPQIEAFQSQRPIDVGDLTQADSISTLAQQVLSATSWPRFAIAGLSMGAIVAVEVARQAPDRVAGLAMMGTNPWAEPPDVREKREPQMQAIRDGQLMAVMRDQMAPKYRAAHEAECAQLDRVMAMADALGPAVFLRQSAALRDRPDQIETLTHLTMPGLALVGEDDRLCPPDRHQAVAQTMPDCDLVVLPQVGHLATLQAPEAVNAALEAWLDRLT